MVARVSDEEKFSGHVHLNLAGNAYLQGLQSNLPGREGGRRGFEGVWKGWGRGGGLKDRVGGV